jgi:hypothetical protein
MGERTILVCDVCGRPAVESVTIKVGRSNWTKDLCQVHLNELTSGARKPRPGRRAGTLVAPGVTASGKRRGRPPGSKNKNPSGSSSGSASTKHPPVKRTRKLITDPAVLEKRRAALQKARQALAEKRAREKKTG